MQQPGEGLGKSQLLRPVMDSVQAQAGLVEASKAEGEELGLEWGFAQPQVLSQLSQALWPGSLQGLAVQDLEMGQVKGWAEGWGVGFLALNLGHRQEAVQL